MKVTSTNQTLILAGERTPGRRRSDPRLATVAPLLRQTAVRGSLSKGTDQYSMVQNILESESGYQRVDVYA